MGNESLVRNSSVAVSTANALACEKISIGYKRTQLIITNTSAAAVITLCKGRVVAAANAGIRLPPNGSYLESSDSNFTCWQGEVQVIADAVGSIAVVEQLEEV